MLKKMTTFAALNETLMEKKQHALRKLLEAVERELLKKPNTKTLDRLSMLAGFQDWDTFQEALHGDADGSTNFEGDAAGKRKKKETPAS